MASFLITAAVSNIICPKIITDSMTVLTTKLITSIYHVISISNDFELQQILLTSDIIQDIEVIKSYVEEKHKENINSNSLLTCINNLNKTLTELESNIDSITKKIEIHKTLWFSSWRSYDITKEKANITLLIKQLNHRFELLVKISSINI
jgi:hypothetical protein